MTDPTPATVASALTSDKTHLPATSMSRVTPKARNRAAERGEAMEDGSFPIRDGQDLKRAIAAFGRAKDKARAKRHIIQRAKALDKIGLLPESWQATATREFKPKGAPTPPDPLTAGSIPPHVVESLSAKVKRHNAEHPEAHLSVAKAATVFRRGITQFAASPKTGVTIEQFGQARVNAFLHLLATGEPRNPEYVEDNDLLPAPPPFVRSLVARGADFKEWEHPRGRDGEWIEKLGRVKIFKFHDSSGDARTGEVVDTRPEGVHVKMDDTGQVEVHKPDVIEQSQEKARLDAPEVSDEEDREADPASPGVPGDSGGGDAPSADDGGEVPSVPPKQEGQELFPVDSQVVLHDPKTGEAIATGRTTRQGNGLPIRYEVRIESSVSDELGSKFAVGEKLEFDESQVRAADDPNFRFGPDITPMAPDDRPADFPAELLSARTDQLVAGHDQSWKPSVGFEEGINSSNILSNGNQTMFVKETSSNGLPGAHSEVDAARLLRRAGIPAPHVERGGHDGILVVSDMAGRGMNLEDVDQWDNVFDGFSNRVPLADLELADEDSLWRLAVTDMALGNADRHGGNLLVGRDVETGKAVLLPIDHELTLNSAGDDAPEADGSDLDWRLDDLTFAYESPLLDLVLDRDAAELKQSVQEFIAELKQHMEEMQWESEENKAHGLGRIAAMQANVDAVLQKMGIDPADAAPVQAA